MQEKQADLYVYTKTEYIDFMIEYLEDVRNSMFTDMKYLWKNIIYDYADNHGYILTKLDKYDSHTFVEFILDNSPAIKQIDKSLEVLKSTKKKAEQQTGT